MTTLGGSFPDSGRSGATHRGKLLDRLSPCRGKMAPTVVAMLKAPRAGEVKTRLAREVGDARATEIYRRLVERQLREIPAGWPVRICFSPADAEAEMRAWLGGAFAYSSQSEGDLGDRLTTASRQHFAESAAPLVFIGGDCPYLTPTVFARLREEIAACGVVLVPAVDGGYCLLALHEARDEVFRNIAWSSTSVLEETRQRLRATGACWRELEPLEDVDDLASWQRAAAAFPELARGL